MTGDRGEGRRPARPVPRPQSRRRWAIAGGIAAGWLVLELMTGSAMVATVLLIAIAGLGAACVGGLRAMGVTRDHPWIRRMASRPWRDGEDVLQVAMRHLSDVFVVTPSGSQLAPNVVELQLNPYDLSSLCERMELGVINSSVTEVYQERVTALGARFAGPGPADVYIVADESIPPGRYRLRQGHPVSVHAEPDLPDFQYAGFVPEFAHATPAAPPAPSMPAPAPHMPAPVPQKGAGTDVWHQTDPMSADPGRADPGRADRMVTLLEKNITPVPALRLITGSSVAETRTSGARAGRGSVELVLPNELTVSREHAKFSFSDGRWWVTNQGINGLTLNGAKVAGEQPLSDGDAIRWGTRPDALLSRVEIG